MTINVVVKGGPLLIETDQTQFIGPDVKASDENKGGLNIAGKLLFAGAEGTPGQVPIAQADGKVTWGTGGGGSAEWGDITGTLSDQTDLQAALDLKAPLTSPSFVTSTVVAPSSGTGSVTANANGTSTNIAVISADGATSPTGAFVSTNFTNTASASTVISLRRGRGTEASQSAVNSGDALGTISFNGHNGTSLVAGSSITVAATENWAVGANGSNLTLNVRATGGSSSQGILRVAHDGTDPNVSLPLANTQVRSNGNLTFTNSTGATTNGVIGTNGITSDVGLRPPTATLAGLPAVPSAGFILFVSDANSGVGTICFSDGTNWIDVKTGAAVA